MKRVLALILAVMLSLCLAACQHEDSGHGGRTAYPACYHADRFRLFQEESAGFFEKMPVSKAVAT